MRTTPDQLQQWLCDHGFPVAVDGKIGPATKAAVIHSFTNTCAPAISNAEIDTLAARLGVTTKQVRAVATVESGGGGYDNSGRPKLLFERHLFHRLTEGKWSPTGFSQAKGGGYNQDSWTKLTDALAKDVDAAFMAASWGKFQVLGMHWAKLNYPSPLDMAFSTVLSEAAHYEMLARYIEVFGLKGAMARLSVNPDDCRAFAKGYNGPRYENFSYHQRLAKAMK